MTDLLERPEVTRRAQARPAQHPPRRPVGIGEAARVVFLVVAAILPFGRVFATGDWVLPLLVAGILPVVLVWVLRRLQAPWWVTVAAVAVAWWWYVALALLPSTLWRGVLPTQDTVRVALEAALIAIQRIAVVPAPVYPEIPLLLLAVTGVWWVACSIAVLALRLGAPGKAIICATTLWLVPLAIVPDGGAPWALSAPLLFGSVLVMLAEADRDALRWGRVVAPTTTRLLPAQRQPSGLVLAVCAVVIGTLL
ncbi:MAG TPA: transglutaminaseTgpA domain-containing protein, partial [Euzebyales bacterium]|nr:transglutaminaseTgpA domain-containing protein [Euzebyales bacterium]